VASSRLLYKRLSSIIGGMDAVVSLLVVLIVTLVLKNMQAIRRIIGLRVGNSQVCLYKCSAPLQQNEGHKTD
jgi:hypothetical protein